MKAMWRREPRPARVLLRRPRHSVGGLHRSGSGLGGPDGRRGQKRGIKFEKGVFPWAASGRAIANGRDEGFTKLIFDADTHRILGGGIVGTHAGDLISEVALAVEMGADVIDIAKTIHRTPRWVNRSAWPRSGRRRVHGLAADEEEVSRRDLSAKSPRGGDAARGFCLADAGARRVLWGTAPEGADKDGQICHCRPDRDGGPALCSRPGCAGMAAWHGAMADSSILWEVMAWPKARHP